MIIRKPKRQGSKKHLQASKPTDAKASEERDAADSHIIETVADNSSENEALLSAASASSCYSTGDSSAYDEEEEDEEKEGVFFCNRHIPDLL